MKNIIYISIFFCCLYMFTLTATANEIEYVNVTAYSGQQTKISDYWYDDSTASYIQPMIIKYNDGTELTYTVTAGSTGIANNNGTYLTGEGYYYDTNGNKIEVNNIYYIGAQGYPSGANHTSLQAQYLGPGENNKIKVYFSAPYHISSNGTGTNTMIRSANGFYFGTEPTDIKQIYFPWASVMFYIGSLPSNGAGDISTTFNFEMAVDEATGLISGTGTNNNFWSFLQPLWDYLDNIIDFLAECWNTIKSLFIPSEEILDKLETIQFPNYLGFVQENFTAIDETYDPTQTNYGTFYNADMNLNRFINTGNFSNKNTFGGAEGQTPIQFIRRVSEFIYMVFLIILGINLTKKLARFN